MTEDNAIYDISVILGKESFPFPGDPPFLKEMHLTIEGSGICNVSRLEMSAHSGTHIDTPAHFIAGGKTLDDYSPRHFILPARVVAVDGRESVEAAHIESIDLNPGDAILLKTNNSAAGRCTSGRFSEDFVYISGGAASVLVEKKAGLVGLDYITIDKLGDETFPAHRKLLGSGIPVLEGINLGGVSPGRYTLICLPLKIQGGEASPVRAVLVGGDL